MMTEHDQEQKTPPWVPISKDVSRLFPIGRPFTEIEAIVSLQMDHNNGAEVTVRGYARRWSWSERRVRGLFDRLGIRITYPMDTSQVQKQRGIISASKYRSDRARENGVISFIDFSQLQAKADRKRSDRAPHLLRSREKRKKNGVSDPRVRVFDQWFHEKFKRRFEREYNVTSWPKHRGQIKQLLGLGISWQDLQYITIEFLLDDDDFLQKAGHNVGTLLTRIGQNQYSRYLDPDFQEKNRHHLVDEPAKSGDLFEGEEQEGQ